MSKFYKVSYEQYQKDREGATVEEYDAIKMPKRATKWSAGYDFYAPFTFTLKPGESIKFATGIGISLDSNKFLACYPRSGLGFKHKMHLWNTVGIVDADYVYAENEGHINVKLCNGGDQLVTIEAGQAYIQGVITAYFVTDDDTADGERTGGMGSTDAV